VGLPEVYLKIIGFLLSYSFFIAILNFIFIEKKEWLTWFILFLPLIFISFGVWQIFLWYLAMTIFGCGLAWIIKKFIKIK